MGAKRALRGLLVAAATMVLFALNATHSWGFPGLSIEVPPTLNEVSRKVPLKGTITSVLVRTDMGEIVVGSGTTHEVRIHETWNYARPTVAYSLRNGLLTVRASCPDDMTSFNKCSSDLTIVVPSAVSVDALSAFGDITTKSLVGAEKLSTDFGDIFASKVSASSIGALTDYGTVRLDMLSAPVNASGHSSFGDVSMKVPGGVYDVSADTDFGDVSVKGITRDDDASRRLRATSNYGDISIARR